MANVQVPSIIRSRLPYTAIFTIRDNSVIGINRGIINPPMTFAGRGPRDYLRPGFNKPANKLNQGQNMALSVLFRPGLGKSSLAEPPAYIPTESFNTKFFPRGQAVVPQSPAAPVELLRFRVPQGNRATLDVMAFGLDNTALRSNYIWHVYANGEDLLNQGSPQVLADWPLLNLGLAPFNFEREEKPVLTGGTLVQVIVQAIAPLASLANLNAMIGLTLVRKS